MGGSSISTASGDELIAYLPDLGALLYDCVHAGANVNFVLPFTVEKSIEFWRTKVLPDVEAGTRVLWLAHRDGHLAGTVQLDFDTPPNQPHRAEVTKLLVHPNYRRRGIARLLMASLEAKSQELGRTLITLDTRSGDSAEPLYSSLGYTTVGAIPNFCRDPIEERFYPTTIMYKAL